MSISFVEKISICGAILSEFMFPWVINVLCISVLEKVESLQEQLDAYNAGEKPVTDTLDIPDGAGAIKPKRCE